MGIRPAASKVRTTIDDAIRFLILCSFLVFLFGGETSMRRTFGLSGAGPLTSESKLERPSRVHSGPLVRRVDNHFFSSFLISATASATLLVFGHRTMSVADPAPITGARP